MSSLNEPWMVRDSLALAATDSDTDTDTLADTLYWQRLRIDFHRTASSARRIRKQRVRLAPNERETCYGCAMCPVWLSVQSVRRGDGDGDGDGDSDSDSDSETAAAASVAAEAEAAAAAAAQQ